MGNVFSITRPLREEDLDERLRLLGVEPRAAALYVTGHGDLSLKEAEDLVADDLAIAQAFTGHYGLGCMESHTFDAMDAAMAAGLTCADIDVDFHEPIFVSNGWLARAGRAWDHFARWVRESELWKFLTQPSAFD
jgi:hypothetical protein